jgi:hypothetical protein
MNVASPNKVIPHLSLWPIDQGAAAYHRATKRLHCGTRRRCGSRHG